MDGYSPILALATGFFETAAAIWTLTRSGRRDILRPVAGILLFLAGYQFIEVIACATTHSTLAARFAFADIIWLPPLGMWLVLRLAAPTNKALRRIGRGLFVVAASLVICVFVDADFVTRTVCEVVFARYDQPSPIYYYVYGVYYQGMLAAVLFGAAVGLACTEDRVHRRHLADVQIGMLGFMLPTVFTQALVPELGGSTTPSILCHYALILALFLTRLVAREHRRAADTPPANP
jgi:hypothetical protein